MIKPENILHFREDLPPLSGEMALTDIALSKESALRPQRRQPNPRRRSWLMQEQSTRSS